MSQYIENTEEIHEAEMEEQKMEKKKTGQDKFSERLLRNRFSQMYHVSAAMYVLKSEVGTSNTLVLNLLQPSSPPPLPS